jgi:glutamate racemase
MIGVFDSGYGGLTVLKAIRAKLPQYDYIYLGDNARCPYGDKSPQTIYRYSLEAVDFLFEKGARLVIIACNTASAQALRRLQREYLPACYPDRRILGVLIPAAEAAGKAGTGRLKVGVIGTRTTIASGAYEREIKKIDPAGRVFGQACPLLVPLVEEHLARTPAARPLLRYYLGKILKKDIDSLILGCTHYPLLYGEIRKIVPKRIKIINPPGIVADKLKEYIELHAELKLKRHARGRWQAYTTDDPARFKEFAKKFLNLDIGSISRIKLPAIPHPFLCRQ